MPSQKPPPESPANGADAGSEAENFKALAKGLFGVSPEEVKEAERREKAARVSPRGPLFRRGGGS